MHKFNAKFITGVNSSVDGIKTVQSLPFGKSSGGKTLFSFRYIFQYKPIISLCQNKTFLMHGTFTYSTTWYFYLMVLLHTHRKNYDIFS